MADRSYHTGETQGIRHVTYNVSYAADADAPDPPNCLEGDLAGKSSGSYLKASKIGTGKYGFTTLDKFLGCVRASANLALTTPDGVTFATCKKPAQNADGTWKVEVWVASSGVLADLAVGEQIHLELVMRNSAVLP